MKRIRHASGSSNNRLPQPCIDVEGGVNDCLWPKRRKATSARMSAIGGTSGLLVLRMSFVARDPERTLSWAGGWDNHKLKLGSASSRFRTIQVCPRTCWPSCDRLSVRQVGGPDVRHEQARVRRDARWCCSDVAARHVETSRSNAMTSNGPHLVGMRADAMRQSGPISEVVIAFAFVPNLASFQISCISESMIPKSGYRFRKRSCSTNKL
jgi:hypothetical protein